MNIQLVNTFTRKLTLYTSFLILILGNIGCILNLVTFTAKRLRHNPCGWYFLMSSIFEWFYINFGLISKLLSDEYGNTVEDTSRAYCKIRAFLTWTLPCIATGFLILAAMDRCFSTSRITIFRSFSHIKMAYRMTCIPILLYSFSNVHHFYFYDLQPECTARPGTYTRFLSFYSIFWTNLIPQCTMLVCGLITFHHVRTSRQQLARTQNQNRLRLYNRRMNTQMVTMMLLQVLVSFILLSIRTIYFSYASFSSTSPKNAERLAIERLFLQVSSLLMYVNFGKSFFINTLTSKLFRQLLIQRLLYCFKATLVRKTRIQPTITTNIESNQTNEFNNQNLNMMPIVSRLILL